MLRYSLFAVILVLWPARVAAQRPAAFAPPIKSSVRIERERAKTVEGTVIQLSGDTLFVEVDEPDEWRGDTLKIDFASIEKLQVRESRPFWSYQTEADISYQKLVWLPQPDAAGRAVVDDYRHMLILGTDSLLACVDPVTGTKVWVKEIPRRKRYILDQIGSTNYGLIVQKGSMEALDLRTGDTAWTSGRLPLEKLRGHMELRDPDQLLIYGETAESESTLLAVDPATGEIFWRQDSLFVKKPKVFKTSTGIEHLWSHLSPLADTDSTFILYISEDGPIKLHRDSGDLLWRVDDLAGEDIPFSWEGYADILHDDSVLFVPFKKKLLALDTRDGSAVWNSIAKFRSRVVQMELTPRGLLVRGAEWQEYELRFNPFLDLLDRDSGVSVWPDEYLPKGATTPFGVMGDTIYIAVDRKARGVPKGPALLALSLENGTSSAIARFDFEGGERPRRFAALEEGFLLLSNHNLMLLSRSGEQQYHRYYSAPGLSFGEVMFGGPARPGVRVGWEHVYIFTDDPDPLGAEGYSLVKLRVSDGFEVGRIWMDTKSPGYTLQAGSGTVYYRCNDRYKCNVREFVAFKFIDMTTLFYAARNGHVRTVNELVERGIEVDTVDGAGRTALMVAADRGHTDVVRHLVDRGANVNLSAQHGWTAWMLAARNGYSEIVDLLVEAGANYSDAQANVMYGWYLAQHGHIWDALMAYSFAQIMDSTLAVPTPAWSTLCFQGSLYGYAAEVMPVCDKAITIAPGDVTAHDSRAVARMQTGDLEGAIADLEKAVALAAELALDERVAATSLFGEWAERISRDAAMARRDYWIECLKRGENPLSEEPLEETRGG